MQTHFIEFLSGQGFNACSNKNKEAVEESTIRQKDSAGASSRKTKPQRH